MLSTLTSRKQLIPIPASLEPASHVLLVINDNTDFPPVIFSESFK